MAHQTKNHITFNSARNASSCATARLWGMKYRAAQSPPVAAKGGFPYLARTCAEWDELPGGAIVEREMTAAQRNRDARIGSKRLRAALLGMAA